MVFHCRNLVDFQACFEAAKRDRDEQDSGDTDEEIETKLCEQWIFANKYGFSAKSFMKGAGGRPHVDPAAWGAYDRDSIMHYSSSICAHYVVGDPNECPQNPEKCVLVFRDTTNPNLMAAVQTNRVPSAGDIAVVKYMYPYRV